MSNSHASLRFSVSSLILALAVPLAIGGCGSDAENGLVVPDAAPFADAARVIDASTVDDIELVAIRPETSVEVDQSLELTVILSAAAPADLSVSLAIAPGDTSSRIPPTVDVAAGSVMQSFTFLAGAIAGTETITATLGGSSVSVDVEVTDAPGGGGGLVINEVDYDQVLGDSDEFVEVFNSSAVSIDMSDFAVVLVNGANGTEYNRVDLTGTLAAGGYLVVGSATLLATVPAGTLTVEFAAAMNNLQNGAPDGVALFQISNGELIDALAYEGAIVEATTNDFGVHNLTEGTEASAVDSNDVDGSMSRVPNGSDTDDADTDWAFAAASTPGASND